MKTFRPLIFLALAGFGLSILSLVIWIAVNDSNDGFAVGEVTEVLDSSIVVNDPFEAHMVVLLNDATSITNNKTTVNQTDIVVGSFVQVTGRAVDATTIDATTVKIIPAPPANRPPHER